jgi:hypothetical protein
MLAVRRAAILPPYWGWQQSRQGRCSGPPVPLVRHLRAPACGLAPLCCRAGSTVFPRCREVVTPHQPSATDNRRLSSRQRQGRTGAATRCGTRTALQPVSCRPTSRGGLPPATDSTHQRKSGRRVMSPGKGRCVLRLVDAQHCRPPDVRDLDLADTSTVVRQAPAGRQRRLKELQQEHAVAAVMFHPHHGPVRVTPQHAPRVHRPYAPGASCSHPPPGRRTRCGAECHRSSSCGALLRIS